MRDLYVTAQAGVVTFEDVVCPRPIVANAKALWTYGTSVKPLPLNVRYVVELVV